MHAILRFPTPSKVRGKIQKAKDVNGDAVVVEIFRLIKLHHSFCFSKVDSKVKSVGRKRVGTKHRTCSVTSVTKEEARTIK